jgi:hypothetical protein
VSDGEYIPFKKSGTARTSRRLYSLISAIQVRVMWEITRSGRTYDFAAPVANEVGRVAREMIDQPTELNEIDEFNWLVVYRADRIARVSKDQIEGQLIIGSHDIGIVRAGSIIVGALQRYPDFWKKDRRSRGLSPLPPRYEGVDDQGLPLDPDHEMYLDLPPVERAKRRLEIEEFIVLRELEQKGGGDG